MFICMAYCEGETLKKKLEGGLLPVEESLDIAIGAAQGLAKAHSRGMVHRDVKPANLMVTNDGVVKVVDFGLAKLAGRTKLTKTGTTMGTINYMSPEQARGKDIDVRSDIFSMGSVLYEMLTDRKAFVADHDAAVLYRIAHDDPLPLGHHNPALPPELQDIVDRALRKEPDERYQKMDDLIADLKSVKIDPPAEVPQKVSGRMRALGLAAVVGLAILITVAVFISKTPTIQSIAVLPLENLTGDPEQEYFVDGMTDALISDLAKISSLRVISRTSIMQYKSERKPPLPVIARELAVDAVIEGSVVRDGDHVRIRIKLIDAPADKQLWGDTFDSNIQDIIRLQSEVASWITEKIKVRLSPQEKTGIKTVGEIDHTAYDHLLRGQYHWNTFTPQGWEKALEHFHKAIGIQPTYVQAYTALANSYMILGLLGGKPPKSVSPAAEQALDKALAINPNLPEVHASLAGFSLFYDWDWSNAEREFQRAISLASGDAEVYHWYGFLLTITGQHEKAIETGRRATELDPLSGVVRTALGWKYYYAGQYDKAIDQFYQAMEIDTVFKDAQGGLGRASGDNYINGAIGRALEQKGMYQEAIAQTNIALAGDKRNPVHLSALAHCLAVSGKKDEAQSILDPILEASQQRFVPAYYIAVIYAGLGDKDNAFRWLEKAYDDRVAQVIYANVDPRLDVLRADPRFAQLIKRLRL